MTDSSLADKTQQEVTYLRPSRGWSALNLADLWRYRELIYFLIWRDIKVRYKQTALGAAWAIIQPFMTMVVFTIFFGRLAGVPSEGVPYPIFSYTALLPWGLFTKALSDAGRAMVTNRAMITKVYFPRLVIPLSSVLSGLVDFSIAFVVLIGMIIYYNNVPGDYEAITITPAILTLPLFILLALVTALGVGLWLSAMNVRYRDIRHIIPFVVQLGLYISPVGFSTTLVPERFRLVYSLNPMVAVIDGFRWAISGGRTAFDPATLVTACLSVTLLCGLGFAVFRRTERTFADVI